MPVALVRHVSIETIAYLLFTAAWMRHRVRLEFSAFCRGDGSLSSRYPRYLFACRCEAKRWRSGRCSLGRWVRGIIVDTGRRTSFVVPADYSLPVLAPALGLAAFMAWAQALAWMPIAVFWCRELLNIWRGGGSWRQYPSRWPPGHGSRQSMAALFSPTSPLPSSLGSSAVVSDRHGQSLAVLAGRLTPLRLPPTWLRTRRQRPFRSAFAAQVWYEWNCHGLMLNGFVGVAILLVWGVLLVQRRHGDLAWFTMIIVLLIIVVVAIIAATGASLGRLRPFWSHSRRLRYVRRSPTAGDGRAGRRQVPDGGGERPVELGVRGRHDRPLDRRL